MTQLSLPMVQQAARITDEVTKDNAGVEATNTSATKQISCSLEVFSCHSF